MPNFNDCDYNTEWTDNTALVGYDGMWVAMAIASLICDKTEKKYVGAWEKC